MRIKLLVSVLGHVLLHATSFIYIRPIAYQKYSPLQLVFAHELNIFHLYCIFANITLATHKNETLKTTWYLYWF